MKGNAAILPSVSGAQRIFGSCLEDSTVCFQSSKRKMIGTEGWFASNLFPNAKSYEALQKNLIDQSLFREGEMSNGSEGWYGV